MATNAGTAQGNSRRRLALIGGVVAAVALAGAAYYFLIGPRGGETEIIVGDGSIRIQSVKVPWADYVYLPGGSKAGEALSWLSKKENGQIETVTDGTATANCAGMKLCVIVLFYRSTTNPQKEATVQLTSGKKGNSGRGLLVASSIPRKEYSEPQNNVLVSNDASYKVYAAFVWTQNAQGTEQTTPLCVNSANCQIKADYK